MDDNDPHCQHWRVCSDCYGRTYGESMESEIAQLRAELDDARFRLRVTEAAQRDTEAQRFTACAERDEARANLARMSAELDEAIEDRKAARDDAARAAALLAVRTIERDARPAISREDAAVYVSRRLTDETWSVRDLVHEALRAHAANGGTDADS